MFCPLWDRCACPTGLCSTTAHDVAHCRRHCSRRRRRRPTRTDIVYGKDGGLLKISFRVDNMALRPGQRFTSGLIIREFLKEYMHIQYTQRLSALSHLLIRQLSLESMRVVQRLDVKRSSSRSPNAGWPRKTQVRLLQFSAMFNAIRQCTRTFERQLATGKRFNQSSSSNSIPWFVDKEFARPPPPHISLRVPQQPKPLPPDAPEHLANLHHVLCKSPLLDSGGVEVLPFQPHQPGPSLPNQFPKGRRRRGRTEFGIGIPDNSGGLWKWVVVAQVKEGTEKRGALQSVFRLVRKELLSADPPPLLPPNRKVRLQDGDGWRMIDAGEFAVHIVSRAAREKYFAPDHRERIW